MVVIFSEFAFELDFVCTEIYYDSVVYAGHFEVIDKLIFMSRSYCFRYFCFNYYISVYQNVCSEETYNSTFISHFKRHFGSGFKSA